MDSALGFSVPDWQGAQAPPRRRLKGRYCRLEPLNPDLHGAALYTAFQEDTEGENWTYLSYGPFEDYGQFLAWMESTCAGDDPLFQAIMDVESGTACGLASFLRIHPSAGSIEIGHIHFAPRLQRSVAATEAMYLLMQQVFEALGYRRYEWKCDALNERSRRAALRLGFRFEGVFRQALVYKGRNRDTAWYSVIDKEWPSLKQAYQTWLAPENFDSSGRQRCSLSALTARLRDGA